MQTKDYVCLECGKRLTLSQADRAVNGDRGCPKCYGIDIDLYLDAVEARQNEAHNASLYAAASGYEN